jgi:protocatechuate 3,4-dioxygenase beta subunit
MVGRQVKEEAHMEPADRPGISRRGFLHGALATAVAVAVGACSDDGSPGTSAGSPSPSGQSTSDGSPSVPALQPTPSCPDGDDATPSQTEGPFFKPDSPERANLVDPGTTGTKLALSGAVVDTACRPISRALIDFWQADGEGNYDNEGYGLRGHVLTDANGHYRVETVVPGLYTGRTRHIHVKVQRPGGRVLTTLLYFPGEAQNGSDGLFRRECLMQVSDAPGGKAATFTFVLA